MKKLLPKLLLGAAGVWVGSMLIYWFNLDNKAIYFLVRPLLDKESRENVCRRFRSVWRCTDYA